MPNEKGIGIMFDPDSFLLWDSAALRNRVCFIISSLLGIRCMPRRL